MIFIEIFKNEKCNIFCAFNDFHRNLQISKNTIFLCFQRFSSKSSKIEKYNILCFRIFSSKSWYGYFSIKPEFSKIMVWIHGMDFFHNYGFVERPGRGYFVVPRTASTSPLCSDQSDDGAKLAGASTNAARVVETCFCIIVTG